MVDLNIEQTIVASVRAAVEAHLSNVDLDTIIAETLQKQVGNLIANLTNKILSKIISGRDLESEISNIVNNIMTEHLLSMGQKIIINKLQTDDFSSLIADTIQKEVHDVANNYNFPEKSIPFGSINFTNEKLPAVAIEGTLSNFQSVGIIDTSTERQMVLTDDGVVIGNNLTAENILASENIFAKNLVVDGDLTISGNIIDSKPLEKYIQTNAELVAKNTLSQINTQNIDLTNRSLIANDKVLLSENTLGSQITNSNLRKVGNLLELVVSGQAIIAETLAVTTGRVGINTEEPRGALTVWDEDSEFTLVKISPKCIFAGSTRASDVSLGSNNNEQIKLKTNGNIEINGAIRINGLLVGVVDKIPERVGEPGEIAVLRDGSGIYRCLSQNRWAKI